MFRSYQGVAKILSRLAGHTHATCSANPFAERMPGSLCLKLKVVSFLFLPFFSFNDPVKGSTYFCSFSAARGRIRVLGMEKCTVCHNLEVIDLFGVALFSIDMNTIPCYSELSDANDKLIASPGPPFRKTRRVQWIQMNSPLGPGVEATA
jgi:hypothetical protein